MKVIIFGSDRMVKKMQRLLADSEIKATTAPGPFGETGGSYQPGEFELAIVDSSLNSIETTCHHVKKYLDIPLVMVIPSRETNWREMRAFGADGYLPEELEKEELLARLRAMSRRFLFADDSATSPAFAAN